MSRSTYILRLLLVAIVLLIGALGMWNSSAQEATVEPQADTATPTETATPTATATPILISVIGSEPGQITAGQSGVLSVFGANFSDQTTIRLKGFGLLTTKFINSGALTADLPNTIPAGTYTVEISDPARNPGGLPLNSPNQLRVIAPPIIIPTSEPPPTLAPATPIPGQPSLLIRNFNANPSTTTPGGSVILTFEVLNQGNRTAEGVSVSVDSGSKFVPASGQASATLPDLIPGAVTTVSLTVITAKDATAGPTTIPITMNYRDFSGQTYSSKGALTVTVRTVEEASQVTLARYMVEPNPVIPGERADVTVLISNTGNQTASQVLLRVGGEGGLLLAGPQGDSFPLGNIEPGASASLKLPLIVSAAAKPGPQPQPLTISYLQNGQSQQVTSSMTIDVASVAVPEALLLLESYDIGKESVQPGEQFTMSLSLQNVGSAPAVGVLVTFGTVESSSGDSGSGGSGSGGSTTTTPSNTFAPLGSGGTVFLGTIEPDGDSASLTQAFIVNGTVKSGVYSLPITLRYQKPDGTTAQNSLRASVVVIAPPRLQIALQSPLPEIVNIGEPVSIALDVTNVGKDPVDLTGAEVTSENGDVIDGAQVELKTLKADEETTVSSLVIPNAEGTVTITITLYYLDELSKERTIVNTYEVQAVVPPPPPDDSNNPPPIIEPTPEPETNSDELLGRALLGFLGLGS